MTVSVPLAIAGVPAQGSDVVPQTAEDIGGKCPESESAGTSSFDCIFSARMGREPVGCGGDQTTGSMLEAGPDFGLHRLLSIEDGSPTASSRLESKSATEADPEAKRGGAPDSSAEIGMPDESAVPIMTHPDPSPTPPTGESCEQGVASPVAKIDGLSVPATPAAENVSPSGRRLFGGIEAATASGIAVPTVSKAIAAKPTTTSSDRPTSAASLVEFHGVTRGLLETAGTPRAQFCGGPEGSVDAGESIGREVRIVPHSGIDDSAPPLDSTPILIRKSGKIDPVVSAGGPAINAAEIFREFFSTPVKADGYSVRVRPVEKGTRRAKGESSMKFALVDQSAKASAVSARAPAILVDSLEGTIGFERNRGRESERSTDTTSPTSRLETTPAVGRAELLAPTDAKVSIPNPQTSTGASDVAPAMRLLHAAMEKSLFRPGRATSLELELPMQDGRPVRVSLELRGDEVRAVFRTESQDMRNALEQAWPQFTQRWQDRGLQFGDARFESSWNQQTPQERDDARRAPRDSSDAEQPGFRSSNPSAATGRNTAPSASSVSLWA